MMNFNQAIESIKGIAQSLGTEIQNTEFDGIIVKRIASSNSLDQGRSSNQTHIAITGEQMDIFPYLCADGYFYQGKAVYDADLKKYFVITIPVNLYNSNLQKLGDTTKEPVGITETHVAVVRSKREGQADQLQVSMLDIDGPDFVAFRKLVHTNGYIVVLKCKCQMKYHIIGFNNEMLTSDYMEQLNELNNKFLKLPTNTPVPVDVFNNGVGNGSNSNSIAKGGLNKIFYGAPGCGKSHHVNEILKNAGVSDENIFRVTFHPEYMNCDFVGQVLPSVEEKVDSVTGEKKETVKYKFNPGPFTLALQRAYSTTDMVYLVIEEINRGNAAAIFGDLFQLLDRVKDETKAEYSSSEYPIRNVYVQDYLIKIGDMELLVERERISRGISIPGNLTIYATMNSSDQNVFTLDTAFKRRWLFEQISNDISKDTKHGYKKWFVPGTDITWETFITKLNDKILDYKIHSQTNEDKRLGKYFVSKDFLTEDVQDIVDVADIAENFAYKVLEYVWNDVCKIGREDWFDTTKYRTLEDLIEAFKKPEEGKTPLSVFQNISFN